MFFYHPPRTKERSCFFVNKENEKVIGKNYDYFSNIGLIKRLGIGHQVNKALFEKELEFTNGFTDLHKKIYEDIISGNGFGIEAARPAIEAAYDIRHLPVTNLKELFHPLLP